MTAPLPISPATAVEATKASSPVAAVVSAMRRIDPASGPVAVDQVRAWADTLMTALYTAQPVRWEYRLKDDFAPGCWMQADAGHVYGAHQRGLVVRALFETPRVIQPEKLHEFSGRVCIRCGDSEDWAGPDCEPLIQKVEPAHASTRRTELVPRTPEVDPGRRPGSGQCARTPPPGHRSHLPD